jgi:hypothetical protein
MANRIYPPATTRLVDANGFVNREWLLFFEKLAKYIRIGDILEVGTGAFEADGNWRIKQDGSNLVHQKRESGTWTTKQTITP